jgi:hypothetical protein
MGAAASNSKRENTKEHSTSTELADMQQAALGEHKSSSPKGGGKVGGAVEHRNNHRDKLGFTLLHTNCDSMDVASGEGRDHKRDVIVGPNAAAKLASLTNRVTNLATEILVRAHHVQSSQPSNSIPLVPASSGKRSGGIVCRYHSADRFQVGACFFYLPSGWYVRIPYSSGYWEGKVYLCIYPTSLYRRR